MIYQIILLSVTILCLFTTTNAQWTLIPGPFFKSARYHVSEKTTSNKYIYALTDAGLNGEIYRSSDLGKNWELIFSDDSLSKLVEVKYESDKKGLRSSDLIVINDDSIYCYKSSALAFSYNSGKTWIYRKTPNFQSSSRGFLIGASDRANYRPNFGILSDGTFIGMTEKGEIYKSTSNGKYWSPLTLPDTSYKEKCDIEYGKLIVSGNKCLVYFPLKLPSRDVSDNTYFLSEDNARTFNKYTFPREYSTKERAGSYASEIKFYPLTLNNDGLQQWYKEEREGTQQHSIIVKTKDSSQESELPPFLSMYYIIGVHCELYGVEIDNKLLFPSGGNLYCYDKIDKSTNAVMDMVVNYFDKSFLTNNPQFPNNYDGRRSCNNEFFCDKYNFWSPAKDMEVMRNSIKELNDNTIQKQRDNEKRRLLEEAKLKREIESIKTASNSKVYKYQFNGWNYKVQKVEIVGDDKIRVKIVETPPDHYEIKETKYQGVKLIQGADVVVDIESLIRFNR